MALSFLTGSLGGGLGGRGSSSSGGVFGGIHTPFNEQPDHIKEQIWNFNKGRGTDMSKYDWGGYKGPGGGTQPYRGDVKGQTGGRMPKFGKPIGMSDVTIKPGGGWGIGPVRPVGGGATGPMADPMTFGGRRDWGRSLFGDLMKNAGEAATVNYSGGGGTTAAIDPMRWMAKETGGIDWGGFRNSEIYKNMMEGIDNYGRQQTRGAFGDSGLGGRFGMGAKGLAGRGLLSSGALQRMGMETQRNLDRDLLSSRIGATERALGQYGGFATSDLQRLANERRWNMDRGGSLDIKNREISSGEARAAANRALQAAMHTATLKDRALGRRTRTRQGLFNWATGRNERDMDRVLDALKTGHNTNLQLATGTPNQSTGARPGIGNPFAGIPWGDIFGGGSS